MESSEAKRPASIENIDRRELTSIRPPSVDPHILILLGGTDLCARFIII